MNDDYDQIVRRVGALEREHFQTSCSPERCSHYGLASRYAGLNVGHIWTAVSCPAYRTLDGADCTCGVSGGGAD